MADTAPKDPLGLWGLCPDTLKNLQMKTVQWITNHSDATRRW